MRDVSLVAVALFFSHLDAVPVRLAPRSPREDGFLHARDVLRWAPRRG